MHNKFRKKEGAGMRRERAVFSMNFFGFYYYGGVEPPLRFDV